MMKAILFASVLAVTIPAGFFSPTPLDSLTMNLNIGDSPRGREQGGGYPPVGYEEEDAIALQTPTPPTTDAREQEVLEKLMQGIKELKELDKNGKLSPQDNAGGDECGYLQVATCAASAAETLAKCALLIETTGPPGVLLCIQEALGIKSKCMPCVCQLMDLLNIPCPNREMDEEEDAMTTTPPTTDAREQEVLEKLMQGIKEVKELAKNTWSTLDGDDIDGKLSPQVLYSCGVTGLTECASSAAGTLAKCALLIEATGPPGVLACMRDALGIFRGPGTEGKCIPCVCQLMATLNIQWPNPEMGQKACDYGGNICNFEDNVFSCYQHLNSQQINQEPPMPSPGGECRCLDPHLGTDKYHCDKAAGRKYCDVDPQSSCVDKFCFNDEKCTSVFACDRVEPPNLCEDCKCMERDQCRDDPNDQCNTCQNASPFKICRLDVNSKCADKHCKEKNNCYGVVACGCE